LGLKTTDSINSWERKKRFAGQQTKGAELNPREASGWECLRVFTSPPQWKNGFTFKKKKYVIRSTVSCGQLNSQYLEHKRH
jgi:hypothetical protein